MRFVVILFLIVSASSSCRKLDPILANYLVAEGLWDVDKVIISDGDSTIILDDFESTINFKECLSGREIQNEDCTAVQTLEGGSKVLDYNFNSSKISFQFEGSDPSGLPSYFIGNAVLYEIVTLEEKLFVLNSKEFYNKQSNGFYDEVQVTLQKQ